MVLELTIHSETYAADRTLFAPYALLAADLGAPFPELYGDRLGNVTSAEPLQEAYRVRSLLVQPGALSLLGAGNLAESDTSRPQAEDLALPNGLPQRVRELARQVTGAATAPYEQASLIDSYLRESYPYSLEASAPPAGRDFVDYFLFDARTGYCTYYSSALAVMLRSLDIPTRWVTGYRVAVPAAVQAQLGTGLPADLDVRNSQAHAWVEAYIDGYGWLPFDPTPSTSPTGTVATGNTGSAALTTPPAGSNSPTRDPDVGPGNGQLAPDTGGSTVSEDLQTQPRAARSPWLFAALTVTVVILCFGLWVAARSLARELYHPREARLQAQQAFSLVERIGARYGEPRQPDETAAEYIERLGHSLPTGSEQLSRILGVYQRAVFAPEPLAAHEVQRLWEAWEAWNRQLAGVTGRLVHFRRRWGW